MRRLARSRLPGPLLPLVVAAAWASAVSAQDEHALFEVLIGTPAPVSVVELLATPAAHVGTAVRVEGRLVGSLGEGYGLENPSGRLALIPEPLVAPRVAVLAATDSGTRVAVSGLYLRLPEGDSSRPEYGLRAWQVASPGARDAERNQAAREISLEELVYGSGRYDSELLQVTGAFRGRNLKHDLPERTARGTQDWILKDGHFAVWVDGKEPAGPGWKLDPRRLEDTGVWLEVVGVPETRDGVVRLRARSVSLAPEPGDLAARSSLGSGPGWADVAPIVSFAYPVPGDPLDDQGRFILQFNKHLDAASLEGRVRVAWQESGGERLETGARASYVDRHRALVVTPETPPPPGVTLECLLLEGIIDVDGRPLAARDGRPREDGLADVVGFGPGAAP